MTFPSLTPMYGLGSNGRTGAAIILGGPRTKIGSQGRVYAWMNNHGQGLAYERYLIAFLGNNPSGRTWSTLLPG
jgi:hypothetical protein